MGLLLQIERALANGFYGKWKPLLYCCAEYNGRFANGYFKSDQRCGMECSDFNQSSRLWMCFPVDSEFGNCKLSGGRFWQ